MKRPPRFQVRKYKVPRGDAGSSVEIVKRLNKLRDDQRVVYLKHNTLVNRFAYWTAIIENGVQS